MRADQIRHIPKILYHQRDLDTSSSISSATVACQTLQAHFQRLKQPVQVVEAVGGHTRVIYPLPNPPPRVSLIIPTRDKLDLLRGTVEGLLTKTDYPHLEIIILDNGSVEPATLSYFKQLQTDKRVTILRLEMPFNYSQLNNIGVSQASGEVIGLLNNDLEVIHPDWLTEMVSQAMRPDIGAVGAKLYYANDTIQHAGVIVGLGGMAGHGFKYLAREAPGYHFRPWLIQNYSAVTAACLVMRRGIFQEVGGLEEKHLKVAFNDVDLCLRLRERGYRIVWTPYAELYHLESASRGLDNTVKKYFRLRHELNYMKKRWGEVLLADPYYNPNLTREYEDFSLA
jgi:GT2 family glycosyltransferase